MNFKVVYEGEEDLEQVRSKMVDAANEYGMQHPLVMYYSRQIDKMHTAQLKSSCG
ncbi:hypothetical protein HNR44_002166 [Geomicrobium halophilum]|uniref:Spo0E like sporulation regulatory protein n=1 Tax=Geomicrobium halophilum TaxID=549000 RepID=A0A841PZ84_9BACL|nr:Spo0E family sporulation regulatory protein-aspartic acid phosphatase [Geomicrobium halophilum]MBB6450183.1 hypothetical protein [Geomicrobium halophilum]